MKAAGNPSDIITLMVDNEFGVLTRVTALIRREGWSIRSLAVCESDNTDVTRLTLRLNRRHSTLDHMLERLRRQTSVREVSVFSEETQVAQELCIVRVDGSDKKALEKLCEVHQMKALGESGGDVLLSFCCEPDLADGILQECGELGLRDIVRTGIIALNKT